MKKLSLVVPAYNEADTLPILIGPWLDFCKSHDWQLIIVNDGSRDGTRAFLDACPASKSLTVLHHKVNRGYGAAIKTGIRAADSEYVITIDADGQHELQSVLDLYHEMETSDADMVIGTRGKANRTFSFRNLGKAFIRFISRLLIPNRISDLNSGMKLCRTDLALKYLDGCPDTMAYSDIIALTFLSEGNLVVEYPIHILPRRSGKSTISLHSAVDTVLELVNIVMFFNPLRIFVPVALITFLAGFVWGLPIMLRGNGLSVGSLFAFIVSFISILLGLIAEQLSQIRKMLIHK